MKLAVIGSRTICNFDLSNIIPNDVEEIVSGGANGIDTLAAEFAEKNRIKLKVFLPEYEKYGKAAPIIRNKSIVEYSDKVYAFWDGQSKGTKYVIDYCKKENIECEIFIIK